MQYNMSHVIQFVGGVMDIWKYLYFKKAWGSQFCRHQKAQKKFKCNLYGLWIFFK